MNTANISRSSRQAMILLHGQPFAGYIIGQYGSIPKEKDRLPIDNYLIEVLKASETRIELIKMQLIHKK